MGKHQIKVGIIGGTGLDDLAKHMFQDGPASVSRHGNAFGAPSGPISEGKIAGVPVALLSRHGEGHKISPTKVNYQANIEEMRRVGCTHILATTACGSLSESIAPGQLVIPDSFLDRSHRRNGTMFDGGAHHYQGVCHVPMEPAFDPQTSNVLAQAAKELVIDVKQGGTIVTIEGPRFSSKAESKAFRQRGGDLINMTTCPEVMLAKEAGILYASIAMATDYDCWKDSEERVCVSAVMAVFKRNVSKVTEILLKAVELIGQQEWDQQIDDLKQVIESGNVSHRV